MFNKLVGNYIHDVNLISLKIFSIFLTIFLLSNSGFTYELANKMGGTEQTFSIALNNTFDFTRYNDKEAYGAKWIQNTNSSTIYADPFGKYFIDEHIFQRTAYFSDTTKYGYLYLREINLRDGSILILEKEKVLTKISYLNLSESVFYNHANKIYSNGGSDTLYNTN